MYRSIAERAAQLDPQPQAVQSVGVLIGRPSFVSGKLPCSACNYMMPPEVHRPYLVVYGRAFDVDAFLADFGSIFPDIVFHRGEPSSADGQPSQSSGFLWYLTDADEEYWKQVTNLERFMHEHYIELSSIRGEANCDVTVFVYNRTELAYGKEIELEPSLMGVLAGLNLSLRVKILDTSGG